MPHVSVGFAARYAGIRRADALCLPYLDVMFQNLFSPLNDAERCGRVVISTMLQNEADALVEWIEYHALLGVEHFYIYDNNSRDDLRRRLQRYRLAHSSWLPHVLTLSSHLPHIFLI